MIERTETSERNQVKEVKMASVTDTIEVNVPVRTAYNQWTQFEEFPKFMEGVKEVKQLNDKRLFWHAEIAGKDEKWEADITEQVPDKVIAWHSISGTPNGGRVSFESLGNDRTRVTVTIDYDPKNPIEKVGDAMGMVKRLVHGDLERFKEFIEGRGSATGAWRGEIHGGRQEHSTSQ
jgi:uncharacterized membrane protein